MHKGPGQEGTCPVCGQRRRITGVRWLGVRTVVKEKGTRRGCDEWPCRRNLAASVGAAGKWEEGLAAGCTVGFRCLDSPEV